MRTQHTFFISGLILILLFSALITGCGNHSSTYQLFEFSGEFQTKDLDKAQMETPFPIITPDYLPKKLNSPPFFKGTLRRYQIDVSSDLIEGLPGYALYSNAFSNYEENVEIQITYVGVSSYLDIQESRKSISLGEPELNPGLKHIDILGTEAIISEGDERQGHRAYLSFQRDGISFVLQSENISNPEVIRVVESMLAKQLPDITINSPESWPWGEAFGRFYTNDIAVAQKETDFRIITPNYIPAIFNQHSPNIEGPLASQRIDDIDTIKLLFFTAVLRESTTGSINGKPIQNVLPVILEISEQSTPLPGQPDIAAKVNRTSIPGIDEFIWTQDIGDMQYGGVTFRHREIYIDVRFYNLALDEVIKVVESLLL